MKKIENFSKEIIAAIESDKVQNRVELNNLKNRLCKKHGIKKLPTNPDILACAVSPKKKTINLLKAKPTRTKSGIAVVAVMGKPDNCPGECIYCPGSLTEKKTPKSYTGGEPATMRALAMDFDGKKQTRKRIEQLGHSGHKTGKIELIIMGGTFPAKPVKEQKEFMKDCINAVSKSNGESIEQAKKFAEKSEQRITGITFETRPDYCRKAHVDMMLDLGGTRCELGVQMPSDKIYKIIKRGHSVKDVVSATALLKDAGFKVCYHLMLGLPGSSPLKDLELAKKIFSSPDFKPDMLKIYPTLVVEKTVLCKLWKAGKYTPLDSETAAELVAKIKNIVPRWTRIMRVQRDIPAPSITAGVKKSNLRQLALEKAEQCNCIRCREAGLKENEDYDKAELFVEEYTASKGKEFFISFEDKKQKTLFGFLRMRFIHNPFRKELGKNTAIVRELRVLGEPAEFSLKNKDKIQHHGLGKKLLEQAEKIAVSKGKQNLAVLSGIGVKEYYRKLGFSDKGAYLSKELNT